MPPGRRVWALTPETGRPIATVVFLDAEIYIERVGAVSVLRELQAKGSTPPLFSVFVSSVDSASRHSDYTCDETYAEFLSEEVVPWALRQHVRLDAACMLVGLSLSGLAAAHAAITHGEQFAATICQSPSFWWSDEKFRESLRPASGLGPCFWISVGNEETESEASHPPSDMLQRTDQIAACQRGSTALRKANYEVADRVFQGGHDPLSWREDLMLALPWAYSVGITRQ